MTFPVYSVRLRVVSLEKDYESWSFRKTGHQHVRDKRSFLFSKIGQPFLSTLWSCFSKMLTIQPITTIIFKWFAWADIRNSERLFTAANNNSGQVTIWHNIDEQSKWCNKNNIKTAQNKIIQATRTLWLWKRTKIGRREVYKFCVDTRNAERFRNKNNRKQRHECSRSQSSRRSQRDKLFSNVTDLFSDIARLNAHKKQLRREIISTEVLFVKHKLLGARQAQSYLSPQRHLSRSIQIFALHL